ncbi:hypothetical protein RB594_003905 [Gaeumannomyces avenae]
MRVWSRTFVNRHPLISPISARSCLVHWRLYSGRQLQHAMAAEQPPAKAPYKPRYVDIGINLADPIFRGRSGGKQRHPDDLHAVVQRARDVGCTKLIVTGSSFRSSRDALKLADEFPGTVYSTAGIHPCSSAIFGPQHPHHHEAADEEHTAACDPDPSKPVANEHEPDLARSAQIIADLRALVRSGSAPANKGSSSSSGPHRLVAFGEFGLDYDRLHFCPKSLQRHSFAAQLELVASLASPTSSSPDDDDNDDGGGGPPQPLALPLFLHSRAAHRDFVSALTAAFGPRLERLPRGGVVHSFTGTAEEARELTADLGLYLGVNGCSFKTAENCDVVRDLPLDRLMIETDGPWCEVRPSHEGWRYLVEHYAGVRAREEKEVEEKQAAAVAEQAARAEAEAEAEVVAVAVAADGGGADGGSGQQTPSSAAPSANGDARRPPRKKKPQQQQQAGKKNQKVSEVPERFKSVKKEKWEEGAMVKSRNEPCNIERIAIIVAGIKGISVEQVIETAWANTIKVFGLDE